MKNIIAAFALFLPMLIFSEVAKEQDSAADASMLPNLEELLTASTSQAWSVMSAPKEVKEEDLEISDDDKVLILNLIEPLAKWGVFKLSGNEEEIKKRGRATAHIHPMKYLAYVFSNPTLKFYVNKIRKRNFGMVWKPFKKGFISALSACDVMPYLTAFSKHINANEATLRYWAERKNWEKFIEALF